MGVALTQLTRPGTPAVYDNFLTTMSLRTGAQTFGQPEAALAYMAVLTRRADCAPTPPALGRFAMRRVQSGLRDLSR